MSDVPATFDPDTGKLTVDLAKQPNVIDVLYHEEQIAEMFGVTVYAVRYWRRNGLIDYVLVNRTVRFTQTQVDNFIANRTVCGNSTPD